jgi:hypothetical protein
MSKTSFLKRLTIRHRILALAAAAVLTSAIVSGIGLVASSYTDRTMAWQDQLNTMISAHKDIDTMHDSLLCLCPPHAAAAGRRLDGDIG